MRNKLIFQQKVTFALFMCLFANGLFAQQDSRELGQPVSTKKPKICRWIIAQWIRLHRVK